MQNFFLISDVSIQEFEIQGLNKNRMMKTPSSRQSGLGDNEGQEGQQS